MPEGIVTALDLMKLDSGDLYPIINENVERAPELTVIPADTIAGSTFELSVRTDLPEVAFRGMNEGVPSSKGGWVNRIFQTHLLDHHIELDADFAQKYPKGAGKLMTEHTSSTVEAAFRKIGKQFYYGGTKAIAKFNDGKGFPGLISQYAADPEHEVDAGGSANKTSVWFLYTGPQSLEFLFGQNRTLHQEPWAKETVTDAKGNKLQALCSWFKGDVGLRLANRNCAVRVKGIGTEAGKGLTDDLMHAAWNLMDDMGFTPSTILMRGSAREQLRTSRITALLTNPPTPKDFDGCPIVTTAQIMLGETV